MVLLSGLMAGLCQLQVRPLNIFKLEYNFYIDKYFFDR